MLKLCLKFDKNKLSKLSRVIKVGRHFLSQRGKSVIKFWSTTCIAKFRIMNVRKVMYAVFFTIYGPAIQVVVSNDKGLTAVFYWDKVLKILKLYFRKQWQKHGLMFVKLLHDNALSHRVAIVMKFHEDE